MAKSSDNKHLRDFGLRLDKVMKEKHCTAIELAKVLGLSRQAIDNYRSGISAPPISKLLKMSEWFGVTVDWLLCREDAVRTLDTDVEQVCYYTGLTEGAVEVLHGFKLASVNPHIENGIAYKGAFNWIDVDDKDSKAVLAYLSRAIETDTLAKIWVATYKATSIDAESIRKIESAETEEQLHTAIGEADERHTEAELERYRARIELDRYFEALITSARKYEQVVGEAEKRSCRLGRQKEGAFNGEHPETDE